MSTATAPHPVIEPGAAALVLGLGKTGLSCARYLSKKGLRVRVADTRRAPPAGEQLHADLPEVELRCGPFDPSLLEEMAQVVISPGVSRREPVVVEAERDKLPVIGDIELFAREAQAPVAAITGTNGKSTVTTLLARFAEAAGRRVLSGGNLGYPALDLLELAAPDLYVLELSSFQLETCYSLKTVTATVLNVTPRVTDSGEITLEMSTEVSSVVARGEENLPVVTRRAAGSTVRVADGGTAIVAGLMDARAVANRTHVPGLGRIPLLGRLFRSDSVQNSSKQVAVFLTATLVDAEGRPARRAAAQRPVIEPVDPEEFREGLRQWLAVLKQEPQP